MRFIALYVVMTVFSSVYAQNSASTDSAEDEPKKYDVVISEIHLTQTLADPPTPEQLATNYEQLVKTGDCTNRQSIALTVWDDRELEFFQTHNVKLSKRPSTLGFAVRISIVPDDEKMKLKLDYVSTYVDEPTENTQRSDVKRIKATADVAIAPHKRLAVPADSENGKTLLLVTVLPSRAELSQPN